MSILAYKVRNIYFYILLKECLVLCVTDDLQFWERDPKLWTVEFKKRIPHTLKKYKQENIITNVNHPRKQLPKRRVAPEETFSDYYSNYNPQSDKNESNDYYMRSRNNKQKTSRNKEMFQTKKKKLKQTSEEKVTKSLNFADDDDDVRSIPPAMAVKFGSADDNGDLTQSHKFDKINGHGRLRKKKSRGGNKKTIYLKDLISKKLTKHNQNKKTDEKESIQNMLNKWNTLNKGDKAKNNMPIQGEEKQDEYKNDLPQLDHIKLKDASKDNDPRIKSKQLLRDLENHHHQSSKGKKTDENVSVFTSDYDTKEMKTDADNGEDVSGAKAVSVTWDKYAKPKMNKQHKKHVGRNVDEKQNSYESTRMTTEYSRRPEKDAYKNENSHVDVDGAFSPFNIAQQLVYLHDTFASQARIEQEVIGRTMNYYDIVLWKIRDKNDYNYKFRASDNHKYDDDTEKKIVFIVHGLDIKGWNHLPCLSQVKQFKTLLSYYLENLDSFDIYLIPLANPDGVSKSLENFAYNSDKSPFSMKWVWEKNLSPQDACAGVALDRNFDVGWNVSIKASSCHMQYPGASPFSERETQAIRDVFHRYGTKIIAYFHVHSGTHHAGTFKGDAILYPKGYTDAQSDDDRYIDLKGEIEEAMRNASFKILSVAVDTLHNWYGIVGGTSVDYASTVYGVPYAMELVMQLYNNEPENSEVSLQNLALQEIWQLLIDVIFDHMYRTEIKNKEEDNRRKARH